MVKANKHIHIYKVLQKKYCKICRFMLQFPRKGDKFMSNLIKSFNVPSNMRKRTNLLATQFYDKIDIYDNKMIGSNNGVAEVTWFYKDYTNIQVVNANLNSQFARIVFVTSASGNKKEVLISTMTNLNIQGDMNKVLFCSGMFSYKKANQYAQEVFDVLYKAFNAFKEKGEENIATISSADEIAKFKKLLDDGIISQDEFCKKKEQLLGL